MSLWIMKDDRDESSGTDKSLRQDSGTVCHFNDIRRYGDAFLSGTVVTPAPIIKACTNSPLFSQIDDSVRLGLNVN